MIAPPLLRSTIERAAAALHRNAPSRITASWRDHSASGMSSTPFWLKIAALLTSTSTGPSSAAIRSNAAATAGSAHRVPEPAGVERHGVEPEVIEIGRGRLGRGGARLGDQLVALLEAREQRGERSAAVIEHDPQPRVALEHTAQHEQRRREPGV